MPASRTSKIAGGVARASFTRRHRSSFWDVVSSTVRGFFAHSDNRSAPRRAVERPQVLEEEPILSDLDAAPPHNVPPQVPAVQQPVLPAPLALPPPPPVSELRRTFRHYHDSQAGTQSNCPRRVPAEQVPVIPASSSARPCRRVPLRRHGAFHERDRPYWDPGSGYEPPVVYGRSPDTLPENQVWDDSWGPVPHISDISSLSRGPPTPQQVIDYLNNRFRLNRRAYCMALERLFPQPREAPEERGIPIFHRVMETSRWRRDHPDWEGGLVPAHREVNPAHADDAADSQAGSDDEGTRAGAVTGHERRTIRARIQGLRDAYRPLAAQNASTASPGHASSSSSASSSAESSSSTSSSGSAESSGASSSSNSSSQNSSPSPSSSLPSSAGAASSLQPQSSSSQRKRAHDEDGDSDADSDITLCEERPSTRRRLDADPQAQASSSPISGRRSTRSGARDDERRARQVLMRQNRQFLPPIGPPGIRIDAPALASASQHTGAHSGAVDAGPGCIAHVPAEPVAESSRPLAHHQVYDVEVLPFRPQPRKRPRDETISELSVICVDDQEDEERDKELKRTKKPKRF